MRTSIANGARNTLSIKRRSNRFRHKVIEALRRSMCFNATYYMTVTGLQRGFSSGWAILIVAVFVLGAILWGLWPKGKSFEEVTGYPLPWQKDSPSSSPEEGSDEFLSVTERLQIEKWITDYGLNQYGDPADTLYAGGSPLFDETTGKSITRWEYMLEKHPDRPWKN